MIAAIILLAGQQGLLAAFPRCSVTDRPVAVLMEDLPAAVRKALPYPMANPGEPFHSGDVVEMGEEDWPFARLICGYPSMEGYVIERERGGRGYNVGKIALRKTTSGYDVARP